VRPGAADAISTGRLIAQAVRATIKTTTTATNKRTGIRKKMFDWTFVFIVTLLLFSSFLLSLIYSVPATRMW
jgi:uncharacterized membrane protein YvbJ